MNVKWSPEFVARVVAMRLDMTMSQSEIAGALGVTKGQISGILWRQQHRPEPMRSPAGTGYRGPADDRFIDSYRALKKRVVRPRGAHLRAYKLARRGFHIPRSLEPLYIRLLIKGHSRKVAALLTLGGKRTERATNGK